MNYKPSINFKQLLEMKTAVIFLENVKTIGQATASILGRILLATILTFIVVSCLALLANVIFNPDLFRGTGGVLMLAAIAKARTGKKAPETVPNEVLQVLKDAVKTAVSSGYCWGWIEPATKIVQQATGQTLKDVPNVYNSSLVEWAAPQTKVYYWDSDNGPFKTETPFVEDVPGLKCISEAEYIKQLEVNL